MSRMPVAVFALALLAPSLALAADAVGIPGAVAVLEVNHSTADTYLQYHGRVVLSDGTRATEYRWGGTSCSNKALPEALVTMLQRAMAAGTPVVPRYQAGQGTNRCLVGFTLTP